MLKTRKNKISPQQEYLETIDLWGVEAQGAKIHIDDYIEASTNQLGRVVLDVETDEQDNFVGIALTKNGLDIFYYTKLDDVKELLSKEKIIGHNLKGDLKWLRGWGIDAKSSQLHYDTILASYVHNTTKKSHGLKDLAKEYLDMEWPSYKEMVQGGVTLDKQNVKLVANYCGMDCLATYRLYQHFQKTLSLQERRYLQTIELPTSRVLMDMELKGVKLDIPYIKKLDNQFLKEIRELNDKIYKEADSTKWKHLVEVKNNKKIQSFNPNSKKHVAALLTATGVNLPRTKKGNKKTDKITLEKIDSPLTRVLMRHSKISKLQGTYTSSFLEKNKDSIIYCNFNQISKDEKDDDVGISTGRLSSNDPNLQNIAIRSEEGKKIRGGFIAREGFVLGDFDFSQIEPRIVTHITKDETFLNAYSNDRDLYQELVEGTGRSRDDGKTFMLALLYGAQAEKLSRTFKCSEFEAKKIINSIMSKLPRVEAWIEKTKFMARRKGYVETLFKRRILLPGIDGDNKWERLHWERVAVNSIIQGTAAEIMKMSLAALNKAGYLPILTVHDSFMVEIKDDEHKQSHINKIKYTLENIVKLNVPVKVSVGVGKTWRECKLNEIK